MTSLIRDSIQIMGDPNTQSFTNLSSSSLFSSFSQANETSVSTNSSINSIPLTKSFQDWWSSPTRLRQETKSNTKKDEILEQAKQRNRKIEFDLFRAVLPSKIYIKPLDEKEEEETGDSENTIWGQLMDVELEDGTVIHEFYLENNETGSVSEQHIVIIHGYMAALGYFIKNIESLVSIMGVRLHIIDLPGFGNSSRAKFPEEFLTEPRELKNKIYQILQIESWFIDKIESWRKIRRIDHFKLIGHSMGAYLSCCYLMKHNNQNGKKLVDDLILISPMGTESSEHSLINNKKFDINLHGTNDPFQELVIEEEDGKVVINEEFTKLLDTLGRPKFPKNYILQKLWQFNMSAFEVLQKLGPFYSKILSYWSFQRFKNFSESDDTHGLILKLHDYSYSIFNQYQGSGELAITKLINHQILARLPLCDRGLVDFFANEKISNMWVYGDKDWMNHKGGEYIFKKIQNKNETLTRFEIVQDAGHHIYLDNPKAFNALVLDFFNLET